MILVVIIKFFKNFLSKNVDMYNVQCKMSSVKSMGNCRKMC